MRTVAADTLNYEVATACETVLQLSGQKELYRFEFAKEKGLVI